MVAIVFTDGQIASASALNAVAVAADDANTAAQGMAASAAAAATNAQHASDQANAAMQAQTNATAFSTASATNAANAAASATAAAISATGASGAFNVGRNYIDNAAFIINQRGTGPWTTSVTYTSDRWLMYAVHTTGSSAVVLAKPGDDARAQIGDEFCQNCLQMTFTGGAGPGDYDIFSQKIEDVHRLSGKTVTVSLWANASVPLNLGISFDQVFGTGGTPSPGLQLNGQSFAIGTAWARYVKTFTLPSIAGKTLGTNSDSYTQMHVWCSTGTTNNVRAGNIGVQNGTANIWGVQLELGNVATAFEHKNYATDLLQCQRFYQVLQPLAGGYSAVASVGVYCVMTYATPLRGAATLTVATDASVNLTMNAPGVIAGGIYAAGVTTLNGGYVINQVIHASSDL